MRKREQSCLTIGERCAEKIEKQYIVHPRLDLETQPQTLAAIINQEVAKQNADTARIDWLEKNGGWLGDENLKAKWTISISTPDKNLFSPTSLRAVIDAAREATEQKISGSETPPASEVVNQETGLAPQRYLFEHRRLWSSNFPDDNDSARHLHFVDCVIDAIRKQLLEIPQGNYSGFNRYDTDDQLVLHVWDNGKSFDIRVPKTLETYYETPWNIRAPLTATPKEDL